jgi:hypothetical protein
MGSFKRIILIGLHLLVFNALACRSGGPHNKVWESKKRPSDQLRKEYSAANKEGLHFYKNSKKRFEKAHRRKRKN